MWALDASKNKDDDNDHDYDIYKFKSMLDNRSSNEYISGCSMHQCHDLDLDDDDDDNENDNELHPMEAR